MLFIGIILLLILMGVALRRTSPRETASNRESIVSSLMGKPVSLQPEASPWSKQVAIDMLNEVVVADEREKVLNMLRRAVETPSQSPIPARPEASRPAAAASVA
jgi:hypothetical protein